jgi:hypothetical protein
MSGCAGSSTKRLAVYLLCSPGTVRSARARFFKYFAGQVPSDRAPGRIGFMFTQRRESRWRPIDCSGNAEGSGLAILDSQIRCVRAKASGGTAPPVSSVWLATNSLPSGNGIVRLVQFAQLVQLACLVQIVQLVKFVQFLRPNLRFHAPHFGAVVGAVSGRPANHGSSLQHPPSPPGVTRLPLTLPWVPAG